MFLSSAIRLKECVCMYDLGFLVVINFILNNRNSKGVY